MLAGNYYWVERYAGPYVSSSPENLPRAKVALVLGTSKYTGKGRQNIYYTHRIRGAVQLYRTGKVQYILVSGDNSTPHYNEPQRMERDLLAAGIPKDRIVKDYAGFRTFDSMLRAKEIFGLDTVIVVSQNFHVRRAVYIGRHYGMHPYGYAVPGPPEGAKAFKMFLRELLARMRAKIDILTGNKPKFLGPKIPIGQ